VTVSFPRSRNTRELNKNPEHSTEPLLPSTERAAFCQLAFWVSPACYFLTRPSSKLRRIRTLDRSKSGCPLVEILTCSCNRHYYELSPAITWASNWAPVVATPPSVKQRLLRTSIWTLLHRILLYEVCLPVPKYAILKECGWRLYRVVEGVDLFVTTMFINEGHTENSWNIGLITMSATQKARKKSSDTKWLDISVLTGPV
jgi:hypothetical protein